MLHWNYIASTRCPGHQVVSVGISGVKKNLPGITAADKNTFDHYVMSLLGVLM
jgi:hypothetical protein